MPGSTCLRFCRATAVAMALGTAISVTVLNGTVGPAGAQPSDDATAPVTETVTETVTVTDTSTVTVVEPTTVTETTTVVEPTTVTETTTVVEPTTVTETLNEPTTVTETTTVTTAVTTTASEDSGSWVLLLVLALLGGFVVSAGLLVRAHRRRGLRWLKTHVAVTPRHGLAASFEARPDDARTRDHLISVVPAEVARSTSLEETP